jgi:hypothetical protein
MTEIAKQKTRGRFMDDKANVAANPDRPEVLASLALSSLWKLNPGFAGFICRSKAVFLTAF